MEKQVSEFAFVGDCGDGRCGCGCGELLLPLLAISDAAQATEQEPDVKGGQVSPPQGSAPRP